MSDELLIRLQTCLTDTEAVLPDPSGLADLTCWIRRAEENMRRQQSAPARWSELDRLDISRHVLETWFGPRPDKEEALWALFLATHWGRSSANASSWPSAGLFYLAFGQSPWTWNRVRSDPNGFRRWLQDHGAEIDGRLFYGNHRKFESKKPEDLWKVVRSYIDWVRRHGGPAGLQTEEFSVRADTPEERFAVLRSRLLQLKQIGPLAAFDHLTLLQNFGILDIVAGSAFIAGKGKDGPTAGAARLWPGLTERWTTKADKLARCLGVPYQLIESALCNWQKDDPCPGASGADDPLVC